MRFRRGDKAKHDQAHRFADWVSGQPPPDSWYGEEDRPQIAAVGWGALEGTDPALGPASTNVVFVLTDEELYCQTLKESRRKGDAAAVGGADSPRRTIFRHLAQADGRQASDGRWELLVVPKESTPGRGAFRVRIAECFDKPHLAADEVPYLNEPEDVAHIVRLWNPTEITHKLDRNEMVTMLEIAETYVEAEESPLGKPLASPESVRMTARMGAEARERGLLQDDES